jgi:hypothetical protein
VTLHVAGAELARRLYDDHLARVVTVPHAAAFLGWGSDVLGYDDRRSVDHGFGPRLQIFVDATDIEAVASAVDASLPEAVEGHSTRFGWDDVPVRHHVAVADIAAWLEGRLGFDATAGVSTRDWLLTPQQRLLEVTAGAVFHDDGRLARVRDALAWYPHDVWLWLLAAQWRRIEQDESFAGRAAEAGDDLGSRLVVARLVRDLMRLCFLLERGYAPYSKWFGSGFARLAAAPELGALLTDATEATGWSSRERALAAALEAAGRRHNAVGVTGEIDATVRPYYSRPFLVLGAGRFVDACLERVTDPALRALPLLGGIDQWVDSTDVLSYPSRWRKLGSAYPGL